MIDEGTAYGLAPATHDKALTEVGAGTPMGELLRRYWHPVGLAADAGATPRPVRVLGEDLILFRDGQGRPGLVHPRCAHRGASLYYGRVEAEGIRCCYHGWMFSVDGRCLDQPCEPEGGKLRGNVRQPWYPLEERYGLVFAYLGPPEKKPLLPRIDVLEQLGEGESLEADDTSLGGGGPPIIPCNWLQHWENVVDSLHVPILHGVFSGHQFVPAMAQMPECRLGSDRARRARHQLSRSRRRPAPAPRHRGGDADAAGRAEPAPRQLRPGRVDRLGAADRRRPLPHLRRRAGEAAGRHRPDALEDERQVLVGAERGRASRLPGRLRSAGQPGPRSPSHSAEHLRTSDRGVALLRRFLREQLAALARGDDPSGVARGPGADPMQRFANCGNFLARRMKVLLLTQPMPAAPYVEAISALAPELELVEYRSALGDAELATVDIALGWRLPPGLAARMPRLGWVCSTAAGVEKLLAPDLAPHVVVSRIVDPEQAAGIAQFVVTMVLRHARELERYAAQQQERVVAAPSAADRAASRARARHRRDGRRDRRLARPRRPAGRAAGTGARRNG